MKSILDFQVLPDYGNCKTFSIIDKSIYNTDIIVKETRYRIVIPHFNKYVDIPYSPHQVIVVNSNTLQLTSTTFEEGLLCLPSGIYEITISQCPNDKLYKTRKYLNICNELHALLSIACESINKCSDEFWEELNEIRNLLLAAKDMVEVCCECDKGTVLFNNAVKRIQKLNGCNTC